MSTIEPTSDGIHALVVLAQDAAPVTMLNLLRYRDQADYSAYPGETACSGREAYRRYSAGVVPLLESLGGKVLFLGGGLKTIIGPADESWDDVLIVRYPSAKTLLDMITSERYRAIAHHRTAALADSRLVATRPDAPRFME